MSAPFVLLQLSDPHLGATWAEGDTVARLAETVDWIRSHGPQPDAVLVTGDLADHGHDEEYERVRALLEPLEAPVHALPGNHDDRPALRRHFALPGSDGQPVRAAVDLGPLRLVLLDTTKPGEDGGELDADRLAWLEEALAADTARPTVLAMHHPPVVTGVAAWDEILLPAADRRALAAIVEAHPQMVRLVAGHLHRSLVAILAGRPVVVAPSTYVQARLDLAAETIPLTDERPGYAVHVLLDGELVSYVQTLP